MNENFVKSLINIFLRIKPVSKIFTQNIAEFDDFKLILYDLWIQIETHQKSINTWALMQYLLDKDNDFFNLFKFMAEKLDSYFITRISFYFRSLYFRFSYLKNILCIIF